MTEAPSLTVESAIAHLNQTEDLGLRYYAAWWLGKFRVNDAVALEALINALTDTKDIAPDGGFPLRRNAAKALGKLGDERAVMPLIQCLHCEDYYVRESAAQSLEMLGDVRAIAPLQNLLKKAVSAGELTDYAIDTVPDKPHLYQPYEAILEALGTLEAKNDLNLIRPFLNHPFAKVKYAAQRAMYQLTGDDSYGEMLVEALKGKELQLRRSALMDLGSIGYVKSARAIASAYAENSLKLIAMKGLLEYQVKVDQQNQQELSDDTMMVMELMDSLL
ncbi:HEAT repeat domain-containing protein [Cyanobacterium stanieri LEGE 03274]|uniref:HEAT repeat domain-containing protein n=1 Tax=Cyanobacterium stanieri LEGE 03274 TaxID=1828756 RepID=A0ABR9V9E8_9CHRO|nr:HEAT repeat domain-containing protein [Cyanobacterium stanieri]MBE9223761.1 HEAT repeat domain-containing protein [Cyanobacterium stanieri LEGE 03274]